MQGPDGDEININGQRGIFNNISLDGGDYNNGFFGEQSGGQRAAVDITLEAVKEFQIVASGANAGLLAGGGVVNVITKSGTNNFHMLLYLSAAGGADGEYARWVSRIELHFRVNSLAGARADTSSRTSCFTLWLVRGLMRICCGRI